MNAAITLVSGIVGIGHGIIMIKEKGFACPRRVPPANEGQLANHCVKAGYAQADYLLSCLSLWSCLTSYP